MSPPDVERTPAPVIPGFEYRRWLGSGGSAEVHLYHELGSRDVAVKVLRADGMTASRICGSAVDQGVHGPRP